MTIVKEKVRRTRLIQTERFVVAVEIDLVIPEDDPSEPCLEPETVNFLKQVKAKADEGDVDWLRKRGKVYEAISVT
ncbi:MAG: hypothetical protein DWH78_03045 [Planctomycetota bacterium]|jgi:hypothetical protein|nr:MAG: hypothetical protein DWH78_03045 [Planctomycetota bacterium]